MAERTRRYPKRPAVFWAVFALTAVLGLSAVGSLWLKADRAPMVQAP